MGIQVSKFLNTATHFSVEAFGWKDASDLDTAFNQSNFVALFGPLSGNEVNVSQPINDANLVGAIVYVTVNTLDGPTTIAPRDDGVDIATSAVIGAGVTGRIIFSFPSIPVAAGSLVATNIRPSGTVGLITIRSIQLLFERVLN